MSTVDRDIAQEPVTDAEVTIYTASTASNFQSAKITGGICSNPSATDTELTINVVQVGGTAGTTNQYLPPRVIFAGQSDLLSNIAGSGMTLKAGDFIVTKASVASNLNVKLSIVEKYSDS
jgi:hypothetical protein